MLAWQAPSGHEPVVVAPATPLISTTPTPSDATLTSGSPQVLKDSATLTGGFHETGNLVFSLYAPGGVSPAYTETVTVSGNGTYSTPVGYTLPTSGTVIGTYQWVAAYSGDANNTSLTSANGNEPVQVHAANPGLGTNANPGNVTLSSSSPPNLTDAATLTGGYSPTGTITFNLYAPSGVVPIDTEIVSASGNGTYTTPVGYTLPTTGTVAGTYQWVATYSGDGNNTGVASVKGNEPVVVAPATPLISTTPTPSDATLTSGSPPILKDSATLTGGFHETGNLVFSLYAPGGVSPAYTETVTVSGNGTYSTPVGYTLPTSGTVIGTYQWVAAYSGDANNTSLTSANGNEPVQVHAANPGLGTNANPGNVTLSSSSPPILTDAATLTGGYSPTGTITFNLYAPSGVVPIHTEIVSASGNGTYTTPVGYTLPTTGTVAGTYQWVATYSGDGNNNGVASAMGHEPVVVSSANLLLSTTINPSDVTLSNDPLPPVVTDTATLTGSYHATGTITFDLVWAGRCDDRLHRYDSRRRRWDVHHDVRPPGPTAGVFDHRDLQLGRQLQRRRQQ